MVMEKSVRACDTAGATSAPAASAATIIIRGMLCMKPPRGRRPCRRIQRPHSRRDMERTAPVCQRFRRPRIALDESALFLRACRGISDKHGGFAPDGTSPAVVRGDDV